MASIEDYISKPPTPAVGTNRPVSTIKPGYRTSEFWLTCATLVVSLLVLLKVVGPGSHQSLVDVIGSGFEWIACLLPQSFIVVKYFKGRAAARAAEQQKHIEEEKARSNKELAELIQAQVTQAVALLKEQPPGAVKQEEIVITPVKKKITRKKK